LLSSSPHHVPKPSPKPFSAASPRPPCRHCVIAPSKRQVLPPQVCVFFQTQLPQPPPPIRFFPIPTLAESQEFSAPFPPIILPNVSPSLLLVLLDYRASKFGMSCSAFHIPPAGFINRRTRKVSANPPALNVPLPMFEPLEAQSPAKSSTFPAFRPPNFLKSSSISFGEVLLLDMYCDFPFKIS